MTEDERAVVAVICFVVLVYSTARYQRAEQHAWQIAQYIPRARGVFQSLTLSIRFIVTMGLCLVLIVQPWFDWFGYVAFMRGVLFIAGIVSLAASATFIDQAYVRWVRDIANWMKEKE